MFWFLNDVCVFLCLSSFFGAENCFNSNFKGGSGSKLDQIGILCFGGVKISSIKEQKMGKTLNNHGNQEYL